MNIFLTFIFMSVSFSSAQETMKNSKEGKASTLFGKSRTSIARPLELRDPFKRRLQRTKSGVKGKSRKLRDGLFSNVPTIDNVPLESIRIVGILIGKERRAIAKIAKEGGFSGESFILKEGMTLGENNAEIKAILPGGVVLVEKIRNVYNQDEYLETVLPVINRF